jgi:tungstate transport system substrate-binding protein
MLYKILIILIFSSISSATFAEDILRLGTTTSTEDSGLLKFLLPPFEAKHQFKVHVISTGTGKAIKLGENGDVDVVLVHSRPDEDKFIDAGYGVERRDVMYNDFIIVGPNTDQAKIRDSKDAVEAMKKIHDSKSLFISRGDDSGTHKMEKRLWNLTGLQPQSPWYLSVGQGMGEVLSMASSKEAYTLADRGTYISFRQRTQLELLVAGDPRINNPYGIIAVNPKRHPGVNYKGAHALINWITSPEGQQRIAQFKLNGEQLFFPNAEAIVKPNVSTLPVAK